MRISDWSSDVCSSDLEQMFDGVSVVEACRRLEAAGADVVGLNCQRGPATLLPVIRRVREAVSCHVAALPVPYRTTEAEPTFQTLTDSDRKSTRLNSSH